MFCHGPKAIRIAQQAFRRAPVSGWPRCQRNRILVKYRSRKDMIRFLAIAALIIGFVAGLRAQQLDPRAYSVSPTGANFLIANYGYSTGDLNFDPSLPIDHASAQIHNVTAGYVRSIGVAGRTANVSALLPYVLGNLQGNYRGEYTQIYRSGLTDTTPDSR